MRWRYIHGCFFQLFWWILTTTTKSDAFATTTPRRAILSVGTRRSCHGHGQESNGNSPIDTRRNVLVKGSWGWSWGTALAGLFGQPTPPTNAFPAVDVEEEEEDREPISNDQVLYSTAKDIPESILESHSWLYGYVEKVMDGDTLRIRHVPNLETFNISSSSATQMPLANTTIVIRVYGIDAPETAKKPTETSQPFADEAQQLTQDLVYHKVVAVKLLRRDKYDRIVGEVETCVANTGSPSCNHPKDVSVELVSRGLATLYTGGGAEYDGKKDLLRKSLEAAQTAKLGIWSLPDDEFVTPQEYKRNKRLAEAQQQP